MTVVDLIRERARERPEQPALVSGAGGKGESTHRLSYAELVGNFDALAKGFVGRGVAAGDRLGLVAKQGRRFVEAALGILAAEACLVPIPDDTAGPALEAFAERARLHHLVREEEGFELRSRSAVESVDGRGDRAFRALAPAYLRFTSGTTSQRKGVILGHATIVERLAAANRALEIGPSDRVLWLLPMAHHFVVSILLYLSRGATILLPGASLARPILELAEAEGASVLYASPYHFNLLAKDQSEIGMGSLRLAISTAEGLRPDIAARFRERFGKPVSQALGIMEVGLPAINRRRASQKPESLGQVSPDYEIWLRGEAGEVLAESGADARPDVTGEICIRGPGLLDAYMDPWLPAGEILEQGSFRTGDQGYFDGEGDLYLAGRRSNRINMAGMKFFSEEVEGVLDQHPEITRSRVFALEHPHLGDIPAAELVARDPANPPDKKELMAHCREQLPAYKVPRRFEFVDDLPLTATGKLSRRRA